MTSINAITDAVKSANSTVSTASTAKTENTEAGQAVNGLGMTFKAESAGKEQNTAVYLSLTTEAQSAVKKAVAGEAWADPNAVVNALKSSGYTATTGKDGGNTYIDITDTQGNKMRIWDVGSDGGIGTQDIDFNGTLGDYTDEIANAKTDKVTDKAKTESTGATESTDATDETENATKDDLIKKILTQIDLQADDLKKDGKTALAHSDENSLAVLSKNELTFLYNDLISKAGTDTIA